MIGLILSLSIGSLGFISQPNIADQQTPGYDWQGGSRIVAPAHGTGVITKINPPSPSPFKVKGQIYICGPNCRNSTTFVIKPEWCRDGKAHIECAHYITD